jgi:hypothetical protein
MLDKEHPKASVELCHLNDVAAAQTEAVGKSVQEVSEKAVYEAPKLTGLGARNAEGKVLTTPGESGTFGPS